MKNTRLYEILKASKFLPEVERFKFAGATDKTIIEAFKEICNYASPYCLRGLKFGKPRPYDRHKELWERNYKICLDWSLNHDRPSYSAIGQKYSKTVEQIRRVLVGFTKYLGVRRLKGSYRKLEVISHFINGHFKKQLYERVLEKILEENSEERK